ncbi:protein DETOXIFICATION 53-like [Mangifera indica]|uniref:protein DETOXIFICATION 53-like n=1 Tax=Mangifera indica TaxID=29780 RepID=UPI001CFBC55D|nr:protein DETOXIFICATION 53-like [Mangifera indica]
MCPGSGTESLESINREPLIIKEDDDNDEGMRTKPEGKFMQAFFKHRPVREEVLSLGKIGGPIVMTTLLLNSRSALSMLFLGRLGRTELAGGSLALACANITGISVIKGLTTGMDPICGQAYGARKFSVLSQIFQKTVCLLLLVSIFISLFWRNMEPIFLRLGQNPDISRVATSYMLYSVPELLAQAILHPMRSFLRAQDRTSPITISAIFAVVLHLPISYLLANHLKLGVKGVALALALNTFNMNLGLLIYIFMSEEALKPWHGFSFDSFFHGWCSLLSLAVPSCLQVCLEWWWYEIMLFLCGLLGNPEISVSAMGILIQTTGILYIFPFAINNSLATRVGHELGAGQPSQAQWTAKIGICLALAFGLAAFIVMTAIKSFWGKLFTDEPQVLHLISTTLPLLGLCEIGNSPQTSAWGVLTGQARPKDGARINLYSFYLLGLPVAVLSTFRFEVGFHGPWYGLLVAQFCCACMMIITLIRTDWELQAKRAAELTRAAENEEDDLESALISNED